MKTKGRMRIAVAVMAGCTVLGLALSTRPSDGGGAQAPGTRFEALSGDNIAAIPGLQVVTIRDNALNGCYTLFIMEPGPNSRGVGEAVSVRDAAIERDRRLAALSAQYEAGLFTLYGGVMGPNLLKYQFEGDIVRSDYERRLRESEANRLAEQIAGSLRLAVSGPVSCNGPIVRQPSPGR